MSSRIYLGELEELILLMVALLDVGFGAERSPPERTVSVRSGSGGDPLDSLRIN